MARQAWLTMLSQREIEHFARELKAAIAEKLEPVAARLDALEAGARARESEHAALVTLVSRTETALGRRLEQRLAEAKPAPATNLADAHRGAWKPGTYVRGELVTHGGSLWLTVADTESKPGTDAGADAWRLVAKNGGRVGHEVEALSERVAELEARLAALEPAGAEVVPLERKRA